MRLGGKTAVITGSGTGVGRAASLLFAREGATVVGVDIDANFGQETAELVRREGGKADFFQADVADPAAVEAMAQQCTARHPKVHVLFNNAAILIRGSFEDLRFDDWKRQLAVNLDGPYLCSIHLLPALKAAGGASIVNNGSIDGVLGNPTIAAYSASKGGLVPLTHVMAHSLAKFGIRVNCINAGAISRSSQGIPIRLTPELRRGEPLQDNSGIIKATPLGRSCTVEECANAALFLASDESSYFTGAMLAMDGGRSALTPGTFC